MNMYVSNLGFHVQDDVLKTLFEPYGEVKSAKVICDRITGFSRGFGFVEMSSEEHANNAMVSLQNKVVEGRAISVSQARDRQKSSAYKSW